jgi:hypothetical protein
LVNEHAGSNINSSGKNDGDISSISTDLSLFSATNNDDNHSKIIIDIQDTSNTSIALSENNTFTGVSDNGVLFTANYVNNQKELIPGQKVKLTHNKSVAGYPPDIPWWIELVVVILGVIIIASTDN